MFFRIKKVKGKEYAYLVENEWGKKGSRQRVKGYIGRAYRFNLNDNIEFMQFKNIQDIGKYVDDNSFRKIICDLVEWELSRHNVDRNMFSVDLDVMKVRQNKKKAVMIINDGFFCYNTLSNLVNLKLNNNEEEGYLFARAFVEAGIKVPQEIFVALFGKLYKTGHQL